MECDHEFVSGGTPDTDEPWMLQTYKDGDKEFVSAFSKNIGNYEWNGITQMKSAKMKSGQRACVSINRAIFAGSVYGNQNTRGRHDKRL